MNISPYKPLILIPARMASSRLPGKPLADICGKPMIMHVWERAMASGLGPVYVAAGDEEIVAAVEAAGGKAVLTDPSLKTGSDRIFAALQAIDAEKKYDAIINVQGDEPLQDPETIRRTFRLLQESGADIATCVARLEDPARLALPQIVKAAIERAEGKESGRALYFSRTAIPAGSGPHYHHIGLYAYRRAALERFVGAPQSVLEKQESLEQLRALALGLHIEAVQVDAVAGGVDTPEDLARVRALMAGLNAGRKQ